MDMQLVSSTSAAVVGLVFSQSPSFQEITRCCEPRKTLPIADRYSCVERECEGLSASATSSVRTAAAHRSQAHSMDMLRCPEVSASAQISRFQCRRRGRQSDTWSGLAHVEMVATEPHNPEALSRNVTP